MERQTEPSCWGEVLLEFLRTVIALFPIVGTLALGQLNVRFSTCQYLKKYPK